MSITAVPVQAVTRQVAWLDARRFTGAVLFVCLILQRFAIPAGSLKVSVAAPIVLAMTGWCLHNGTLVLDRRRTGLFMALFAVALAATAAQASLPVAIAPRSSLNSLIYWLAITFFAVPRFREPMEEQRFFRLVGWWITLIAIAGVIQFVVQFAGLRVFSFTGAVPDQFMLQELYNVEIPMEGTNLFKSNGFFLVEPSVFSQIVAIGIVVEAIAFRRASRFALYAVALFVSVSGTGWLVLGGFVIQLGLTTGLTGIAASVLIIAGLAVTVALANVVAPDIVGSLLGRTDEISLPGSSGYERFVTPFLAFNAVLAAAPWMLLVGIGPGASETLAVPFFYTLNTPVKIILEYGAFGLFLYVALVVTGTRTRRHRLLVGPLVVLLLFTGGYHQFPPILFFVLLVGTVAVLQGGNRALQN